MNPCFVNDLEHFLSMVSLKTGGITGHVLAETYFGTLTSPVISSLLLCSCPSLGLHTLSTEEARGL
jgi:hypothetical protein